MQTYKAAVDAERLWKAQIAARKLPAAMLEASLEVEKISADFDPVFLKRQSNRGVGIRRSIGIYVNFKVIGIVEYDRIRMTLEGPVYSGLALLVWSADDKSRFGSQ